MSIVKGIVDGIEASVSTVAVLLKQGSSSYTDLQTADSENVLVTNEGGLVSIIKVAGVVGLVGEEEYKRIHGQLFQMLNLHQPVKLLDH